MRKPTILFVAAALLAAFVTPALALRSWQVERGTVSLALQNSQLAALGLEVIGVRSTGTADAAAERISGELRSFALNTQGLRFSTQGGVFQGFESGRVALPVRGGLTLGARDGVSSPVFLYDFTVEIEPSLGKDAVRLVTSDPVLPSPFDARDAGVLFLEDKNELSVVYVDLVVSRALATALGKPDLEGTVVGTLDVELDASTPDPLDRENALAPGVKPTSAAPLDLTLAELYGLSSFGRTGAYPAGRNGLSAATTSCNTGGVNIPWNAPMAETHPFIGLGMFRLRNGVLEQIGVNWIKHGFFALSNNQCNLGCSPSGGSYMGIGCSDTYSSGNNASQFYLGPRKELNPHLGAWEACGSFFDEPVSPDAGCTRTYNGSEPNEVNHRLEVWDEDLGLGGATYYYEGVYYLADDGLRENNIGWRQCNTSWNGFSWQISTVGGGNAPNAGLLVETWGDMSKQATVAVDDGEVVLAVDITDLGDGNWHYEYVLYNWTSDRGIYSFAIPIGTVPVENVSFRDIDKNATNQWTSSVADGFVTWSTEDYATNPNANALGYGTLYNFRFDSPVGPGPARSLEGQAQCGIFKPGEGTTFFVDTLVPDSTPTSAVVVGAASGLALKAIEPNPFGTSTRIAFSLPRRQQAKLSVIDVTGRTVRVLLDGEAPEGTRDVRWDGLDGSGQNVASGIYMLRLETADGVRTAKVARLR